MTGYALGQIAFSQFLASSKSLLNRSLYVSFLRVNGPSEGMKDADTSEVR